MVIKHNLSAMNAQRQYNIVGKRKAKHTEKLSSGYRINRAADDAAGLSISEKLRRQIRGLNQGIENTQDGVSLCQVADGALNEVHDMLHRLEELSVQAANGTNSKSDREMIQQEADQILSEINRISDTTMFNEQNLFGGVSAGETAGNSVQSGKKTAVQSVTKTANVMAKTEAYAVQYHANVPKLMTYGIGAARAAGTVCGGFTVSGGTLGTDYTFSGGVLTIISSAAVTIQNTNPASATTNRIEVAGGVSANITLAGVNIDVSSQVDTAAFKIADDSRGNVTVTLAGSNTLKSGENRAGLQKTGGISTGTLKIKGNGSLTAMGGQSGAGIGGGWLGSGSNITISGGTVTAMGGLEGAGIGGGFCESGNNITISGGTVTATGGRLGAGIGGGNTASGNNITISGGTVTATGGKSGAGIGGGFCFDGNNITISGGTVTATGGQYGAGIGGGDGGIGSSITISGTNTVVAVQKGYDARDVIGSGSGRDSTSNAVNRNGGLIIEGNTGKIYGDVTLKDDFTIAGNVTFDIDGNTAKNSTLTIGAGVTLTNNGTININKNDTLVVNGKLANNGTINNDGAIINTGSVQEGMDAEHPKPSKRWWIQCGSEAGVGMFVEIDFMNTNLLGLSGLNVTTEQGADAAMDAVSAALAYVSALRSKIGAQQNRLEHTIANESNIVENTTAAESRIRDTDMAEEMAAFSLANILEQAGNAMLVQANLSSEGILSLLQ